MTAIDLTTDPLPCLVPEGKDFLDDLTVQELGIIGRQLECDPYEAVSDRKTGLRWEALGRIAWLWAKRTDPRAKLATMLDLRPAQVTELLGMGDDDTPAPADDDEVDEDDLTDDADPVVVTPVVDELAANPTEPLPVSPSHGHGDYTPTPS